MRFLIVPQLSPKSELIDHGELVPFCLMTGSLSPTYYKCKMDQSVILRLPIDIPIGVYAAR